jgi:iron complex transport system ATP-binding protein
MNAGLTTPSPTPALRAVGLSVDLGSRRVLSDVSCEVAAGRWLAVAGPNGAGKSTLLRALAGVLPAGALVVAGEVWLGERRLSSVAPRERALQLAWMGQTEPAPDDLLARDVVMLARWPRQAWWGAPSAGDAQAANEALAAMDALPLAERPMNALSGGERQRVLLARALAVGAGVLLLDEPLAHLDAPHQVALLRTLRRLAALGTTVVTVAHELAWALHADELLLLKDGRAVHHGGCLEAATHRAVEQAFDGSVQVGLEVREADEADEPGTRPVATVPFVRLAL